VAFPEYFDEAVVEDWAGIVPGSGGGVVVAVGEEGFLPGGVDVDLC
jgi:hypothetical protein